MFKRTIIVVYVIFNMTCCAQEIIFTPQSLELTKRIDGLTTREIEVLNLGTKSIEIRIDADTAFVNVSPQTFTIAPQRLQKILLFLSLPIGTPNPYETQVQFYTTENRFLDQVTVLFDRKTDTAPGKAPVVAPVIDKRTAAQQAILQQHRSRTQANPTSAQEIATIAEPREKGLAPKAFEKNAKPKTTLDDPGKWEQMFTDIEHSLQQYMQKVDTLETQIDSLQGVIIIRDMTISDMREQIRHKDIQILTLTEQNQELVDENKIVPFPKVPATAPDSLLHDQLQAIETAIRRSFAKAIAMKELSTAWQGSKLRLTISGRITFHSGEMNMTERCKELLGRIATTIREHQHKAMDILVLGHTDSQPYRNMEKTKFGNWELSAMRSARVVRELQIAGHFDGDHLRCVGNSLYQPVASNDTRKGRIANRRIELLISMAGE